MVAPLVLATAHARPGREMVLAGLQRICFWGSILLPMTYLLVLYGVQGRAQLQAVAALMAVHALFLLIGKDYSR